MPLIISPKTTERVIRTFTEELDLRKVPEAETKFWHGNFRDSMYKGLNGNVMTLFTGYSGATVGHAIFEYRTEYFHDDCRQEIYFVGSVYAFRDSPLDVGDIAFATDSFSPDSFEQSIYRNAEVLEIKDVTKPDANLLQRLLLAAKNEGIVLHPTKVHCQMSPGHFPDFAEPRQLMNEAMWWKLSMNKITDNGCDSGEYESAAALATSRLFRIPAVALFDVKDKRYSEDEYRMISNEQKDKSLRSILRVVKRTIINDF